MLQNVQVYSEKFNFAVFEDHPVIIYNQPRNGMIYFVKA